MNDHRTGEVMELVTGEGLDPGLHTKMLVPDDAFKERINKSHDDGSS